VFFVSDANACRADEEHNATLAIMMMMFADVCSTDEMIALLQCHTTPVAGAAEAAMGDTIEARFLAIG